MNDKEKVLLQEIIRESDSFENKIRKQLGNELADGWKVISDKLERLNNGETN